MEWSEALGAVRRGGELVGCLNFLPELQNQRCSLTLGCELGPCDSDITWAACKLGTMAEDFQNRLDNIFGALDQHNPRSAAPSWSITDRVVQNRGQGRSDSESEDEQEHQECIQVRSSTHLIVSHQIKIADVHWPLVCARRLSLHVQC